MIVPCWIFLAASLLLTTELVTALQIPINNSLLFLRVEGVEGVEGIEGVMRVLEVMEVLEV